MNVNAFLLLITAIVNTVLGRFVYKRNPTSIVNKSFAVYTLIISFWTLAVYMGVISWSKTSAFLWIRLSFITAAFIPAAFYSLTDVFPEARSIRFRDMLFFITSACLAPLLFTTYLLKGVTLGRAIPITEYGVLFPIFVGYFIFVMVLGFFNLVRKWKVLSGLPRLQVQYVTMGILGELVFAAITNFLAPLIGIEQVEGYGPLSSLIMTVCTAYAIARYHLMDITLVIKRTTVYALLMISITIGYVIIVLLASWLTGSIVGLPTLIATIIAALMTAFAFAPLKEGIQVFVERTLFKKRYDHRKILSDLSQILSSIHSLEELLTLILNIISDTMGISGGSIYLADTPDRRFVPCAHHGKNRNNGGNGIIIQSSHPLVVKLIWRHDLIIREQFERLPQSGDMQAIIRLMKNIKADICIPIYLKNKLTGMLFLGSKETGHTFTIEDIGMFSTLSNQIAVAIENAQLYTKMEEGRRYQGILINSMASGFVAIDLNKRVTAFNQMAEKMLNLSSRNVIGNDVRMLVPALSEILTETLDRGAGFSVQEAGFKMDTGKDMPLAVSSSIFRAADGKPLGAHIVFSDITERKVLEGEMRRADRLASLGTLAAGMAHEIKNPLVALKTFTQLMPERYMDKEFREDFAKLAGQEVDRINYLVERLLDFARPSVPAFRKTNLKEILEGTIFLLNSKIMEQNVELTKKIDERPLFVLADGDQMKQVLLNIIINSLQAMGERGNLTVTAKVREAKEASIGAPRAEGVAKRLYQLLSKDCVIVEISDTGKGIDPHDMPHLFDPFFTTKASGAGLGLAIAHSIVGEHGGIIDVRSEVGAGTTFSITLPMLREEQVGIE